VHTPEFEFEKEYNNVQDAANKYNIKYPIVQDNFYATWSAYKNRFFGVIRITLSVGNSFIPTNNALKLSPTGATNV